MQTRAIRARLRRVPGVFLAGVLAAASAAALENESPAAEGEATPLPLGPASLDAVGAWRPPEPRPEEKEWVLLKSGEWVRGEIKSILNDTIYFDSDELDDLEIDWDDASGLLSPKHNTYRFYNEATRSDEIVTGTAAMRDGLIRVDTGGEVLEFPRDDLLSMIEGDLREINYWSLDVGVGLTLRSGNSDQTDVTLSAQLKRETPISRALLSFDSANSVVDGDEVTDNQRLRAEFDYYVSKRAFVAAPIAEGYRDHLQNIDLRLTVGAGVGYEILDWKKVGWRVVGGAGYQRTSYQELESGESNPANDAALLFGTTLELDPWSDVDWDTTYQLQAVVTDFDKTNHHLQSVFSFDVWGPLDLDVTFTWDRIEGPATNEDGQTPKSNDFRLTAGLALEL